MTSSDINITIVNTYSVTMEQFEEMDEITIEPVEIDDITEMNFERQELMNSEPRDRNIPMQLRIILEPAEICPYCNFPKKKNPAYQTRRYKRHRQMHRSGCPKHRIYQ